MLEDLIRGENIETEMLDALKEIHVSGPSNPATLEKLAHIKRNHGTVFARYESKLMYLMGLFYKKKAPSNLLEEIYSIFSDSIERETGKTFTPIQADAYKQINNNKYFSFSTPTSAGKSFLFRELVHDIHGDIIIVVPSRALIAEYFYEVIKVVDKNVLVLQFIEDVNKENVARRIFIITPERGGDLFKYSSEFNVELFLLDEAHISEELVRGMKFDSFVRRVDRVFPHAKKVFAHPFVSNPGAQLRKHDFKDESSSRNYDFNAVGKIFISYKNEKFRFFSPYTDSPQVDLREDIAENVLKNNGTMLVYISKRKIYTEQYMLDFSKYIDALPKITNKDAIKIIERLRQYIGASRRGSEKHSTFLSMMEKGVVIHHGSMPLKARLLIEVFIRANFARICFATSTLSQGINMPFDIIWIDNFRDMNKLTLKNLIGRSGRSTVTKNSFDYGYTIVKSSNVNTFSKRLQSVYSISEKSLLDADLEEIPEDLKDIVEAIQTDSFNDELHLTKNQLDRLAEAGISSEVEYILDNLMEGDTLISGKAYYNLGNPKRNKIKSSFKSIYAQHLRRKKLTPAEQNVLSTAIPIMLWRIQGKSFSEIVSLRHSFLSKRDERRKILSRAKRGEIPISEANSEIKKIEIKFTQPASSLPNKDLRVFSLFFEGTSVDSINFDMLVYDTYDYLDKVISYSLCDPICAVLELFYNEKNDPRAKALKNFIRFGTNDDIEIWLLRYGLDIEDLEWLKEHIEHIDSKKITFKDTIYKESKDRLVTVERYL